jgi:hypothetical protein
MEQSLVQIILVLVEFFRQHFHKQFIIIGSFSIEFVVESRDELIQQGLDDLITHHFLFNDFPALVDVLDAQFDDIVHLHLILAFISQGGMKFSFQDSFFVFDENLHRIVNQASDGLSSKITDPVFLGRKLIEFRGINTVFYQIDQVFQGKIFRYQA